MQDYLILKLQGPMQAWGGHSYEDFRPSGSFPGLSAVLGLLGACLGIDRDDRQGLQALADGVEYAVRADRCAQASSKLVDFHTVLEARKVDGSVSKYPVVSRREYLCDAQFTIALRLKPDATITLVALAEAVRRPVYTPVLGRRSCPLTRPLFEVLVNAESFVAALAQIAPAAGVVYGVEAELASFRLRLRDRPLYGDSRQFASRELPALPTGDVNVSQ